MTRLFNEPSAFADEMIEGFVASHNRWVKRVSGGVVRNTRSTPRTVALVIGGGSGHYPAVAGLVGQGLAQGAAMGNLFASLSAQQIYNVAKAADNDGGVLLGYGNYAGGVLHFNQAQDRLRKEGIDCRSIAVTDDISSAPPAERAKRRGIAGDLTVFKVSAAAEAAYSMDAVLEIAERANDRTRSFGVAFTGRTLPGADHPLFSVPEAAAYRNGLTPVLCVGELQPGSVEQAIPQCTADINAALNRARSLGPAARTIVAYEPQWAIGSPEPATPEYISAVVIGLDPHLRSLPGQEDSRTIYGGSAGPGLIGRLDDGVTGLFLGRFAHDPKALKTILDETAERLGLLTRTKATP